MRGTSQDFPVTQIFKTRSGPQDISFFKMAGGEHRADGKAPGKAAGRGKRGVPPSLLPCLEHAAGLLPSRLTFAYRQAWKESDRIASMPLDRRLPMQ